MKFFHFNSIPKHWFIIIFGLKVICSILLTIIYSSYYSSRATADIFKYFDDSKVMFDALTSHPIDYFKMLFAVDNDNSYFNENYYQYMNHWVRPYTANLFSDSHIIIRFNAFVRLFSFGYFNVHNVFINFLSLVGLTLIFKAFKSFLAQKEKALFYVIFLAPSVLFWGSGLLKESLIFLALGLLLVNLFKLFHQIKIIYLFLIVAAIILIMYTKFYLLIAFSIPVGGYLINQFFNKKNPIYGYLIATIFFIICANVFPLINDKLDIVFQIANKQQVFSRFIAHVETNSGFLIPHLTDGLSILKTIQNALVNTLIRPFFWECKSVFVLLSAFENTAVLFAIFITLYFRKKINNASINILCFNLFFVFGLFVLIGLTTPVFGAIMRYKIPGLILLLISLLIVIDLQKVKNTFPFLNKIL